MIKSNNNCHGVLLLDKPYGISSNGALQRVRKVFGRPKAGHGGTLDPCATGMLPLFFGHATRFAGQCLDGTKTYQATIAIGSSTSTADSEGDVCERRAARVTYESMQLAAKHFVGSYQQVPPQYSAIKISGRQAYKAAREGQQVNLKKREVTIYQLDIMEVEVADNHTYVSVSCCCSKGTYIRSLAVDIGAFLGYPAHLSKLHRTACGQWQGNMITLQDLENCTDPKQHLILLEQLFEGSNRLDLDATLGKRLMQGQRIRITSNDETKAKQGIIAVFVTMRFIGICYLDEDSLLTPDVMLPQDWLESFL